MSALSYVPLFLNCTTITTCSLFFSAHNLFVSNNTCSLDLYSEDLQNKTAVFTRNVSSQKTNWITTTHCLFCLAILNVQVISLMKVLEVERSGLCFIEISIATTFLFMDCAHSACGCFHILYIQFSLLFVVVGLLGTSL